MSQLSIFLRCQLCFPVVATDLANSHFECKFELWSRRGRRLQTKGAGPDARRLSMQYLLLLKVGVKEERGSRNYYEKWGVDGVHISRFLSSYLTTKHSLNWSVSKEYLLKKINKKITHLKSGSKAYFELEPEAQFICWSQKKSKHSRRGPDSCKSRSEPGLKSRAFGVRTAKYRVGPDEARPARQSPAGPTKPGRTGENPTQIPGTRIHSKLETLRGRYSKPIFFVNKC